MEYEKRIDKLISINEIFMLESMIEDCKNEDRLNNIKDILCYLQHKNSDSKKKKVNEVKSDIKERLSKIDEYLYRRPWNRLDDIHKKNKLEEYISNYLFNAPEDNIKQIRESLLIDLKNKKLNSAKTVTYDPASTTILNIANLDYDNEKCLYTYK